MDKLVFKTIKEANDNQYWPAQCYKLYCGRKGMVRPEGHFVPKVDTNPVIVKGHELFHISQMIEVKSKTRWKDEGRKIKENEEPYDWNSVSIKGGVKRVIYPLYTVSQTTKMAT